MVLLHLLVDSLALDALVIFLLILVELKSLLEDIAYRVKPINSILRVMDLRLVLNPVINLFLSDCFFLDVFCLCHRLLTRRLVLSIVIAKLILVFLADMGKL